MYICIFRYTGALRHQPAAGMRWLAKRNHMLARHTSKAVLAQHFRSNHWRWEHLCTSLHIYMLNVTIRHLHAAWKRQYRIACADATLSSNEATTAITFVSELCVIGCDRQLGDHGFWWLMCKISAVVKVRCEIMVCWHSGLQDSALRCFEVIVNCEKSVCVILVCGSLWWEWFVEYWLWW